MRHAVNFALLVSFAALAATGIAAFVAPFSITNTRVHVVSAAVVMMLITLHLVQRVPYFRSQWKSRPRQRPGAKRWKPQMLWTSPRFRAIGSLAAAATVVGSALWAIPPTGWMMSQSYEARQSATIFRASPLVGLGQPSTHSQVVVRTPRDPSAKTVHMYLSVRDHVDEMPSIAVWAESTTGTMIETLHLHREMAFAETVDWHGALLRRDHVLPIWRHRYTELCGISPDGSVDGISGATAGHEYSLDPYLAPSADEPFVLCVEINAPGDANDAWPDKALGQPSLLYTGFVEPSGEPQYVLLELTGHGGDTDGVVRYDLDAIGDARSLVDLLLLKVAAGRNS